MARAFLAVALLAFVVPTSLAATGGPASGLQSGSVGDGETIFLAYSTNPSGTECLAVYMPRTYTVSLAYAPIDDTLTLTAGLRSDVGATGHAAVSFVANYCTAFTILVEGTDVASSADFVVTVTSTPVVADGAVLA